MTSKEELLTAIGSISYDEISEPRNKLIDKMISYLDVNSELLDEWQQEFLYDIHIRFSKGQGVSDKQYELLVRIYNETL